MPGRHAASSGSRPGYGEGGDANGAVYARWEHPSDRLAGHRRAALGIELLRAFLVQPNTVTPLDSGPLTLDSTTAIIAPSRITSDDDAAVISPALDIIKIVHISDITADVLASDDV
jgi:hypothetical protein